jgi:hypothetical protein
MRGSLLALLLVAASAPAWGADVGVSISVGEPGFYGRLDIGGFPPPAVIYPQPVIIAPVPAGVVYEPLYLHVPPDYAAHWRHHCGHYNACGRPVYFVQDRWYNDVYVPRYHERHGDHGHGHEREYHGGHGYHGEHGYHGGHHARGHQDEDD